MPRFFFHYRDAGRHIPDAEGVVLPDAEAAWFQAVRNARDLIEADRESGALHPDCCFEIADERGTPVDALPLSELVGLAS